MKLSTVGLCLKLRLSAGDERTTIQTMQPINKINFYIIFYEHILAVLAIWKHFFRLGVLKSSYHLSENH